MTATQAGQPANEPDDGVGLPGGGWLAAAGDTADAAAERIAVLRAG